MTGSDDEGFEVIAAQGSGIRRSPRKPARDLDRTALPSIPKVASSASSTHELETEALGLNASHPSRRAASSSNTKRKRTCSTVSRASACPSSDAEVDELEEGSHRRYRKPSISSSSSKSASRIKAKGKAKQKDDKPKKPTKAALERQKLEEIRKDKHFKKLDDANIRRIARAHHERLYLIHRYRQGDDPKEAFDVCGSKGNVYKILVDRSVSCTCMDFKLRRQVCKHLLFVYIKVLRLGSHMPVYNKVRLSNDEVEKVFEEALDDPVAQVMAKPELRNAWEKAVGYKSDDYEPTTSSSASNEELIPGGKRLIPEEGDVCGVCYEDLEAGSAEGLEFCLESCGRPIHTDCLETWFNTRGFAQTCIWCRARWRNPLKEEVADKKHQGYGLGLGHRGNVVDGSGRQLNLAATAGLEVVPRPQPENENNDNGVLPDVADLYRTDVDGNDAAAGWD
ncbi:uncharacterized protein MEPE_02097 [Melanopsichium pennsylvanicum]|uniref:SWIM-type domain-containing protein n=2 Tax=Melanopsichium pennsylvanicum TaxID=63383 RepID=A0AAJ4XIY6_9BASI|nr:protein kinase [Melanopsichium pennsylvanicum 4]SNX83390.1 uncharacterized protein MEPE_02097 [Melanopsichium pennsylvanicum]